jgi:hypothetical protein
LCFTKINSGEERAKGFYLKKNGENMQNRRMIVLWLSGLKLEDVETLPEVRELRQIGSLVELESIPITGPQMHHYQILSGQPPACFGFFDTVVPQNYTVVEQQVSSDTLPQLLPDILSIAGWRVSYHEIACSEPGTYVENYVGSPVQNTDTLDTPDTPTCLIVKSEIAYPVSATTIAMISGILRLAQDWVGADGLLALLSDIQPVKVKRYVNVNNFLADMGIIEFDEQSNHINWSGSLAYYAGHGQLWINLQGRDAQGSVHPQGDYEDVCNALVAALPEKLRDPETDEPVIERVYRKKELYSGDYLFRAPDLVVLFKPGYAPSPRSMHIGFDETVISIAEDGENVMAGVHPSSSKGFLLASAPAFEPGRTLLEPAQLTSVLPTLLHALGIEYTSSYSPVISDLFSYMYLAEHPIHAGSEDSSLSDEDEEHIINHLRDLGYL